MKLITSLKQKARRLKTETATLYLACRDPRVPWYAKVFMAAIVGYALNPIDLIPDFIPVLGYVDDLVIVPAGVFLALKMIPREVLAECRAKAQSEPISSQAKWVAASVIIAVWLLVIYLLIRLIWHAVS
ncbi:MAG: DUF1232 domain-containing protein [Chloroflexi bacterium]|nr:DUF1232 domain-containing protein [Chloroflexota bacterium]